jgi:DNA repair photolyase
LRAIRELTEAGIPVGVMFAPVIPGLNDHEVSDVLSEAAAAGAISAGYTVLRLPYAVKDLFQTWLEQHYPERKEKILGRIRDARNGLLTDPRFGSRMSGEGPWADSFRQLFHLAKTKCGLTNHHRALSTAAFRRSGEQLQLF